MTRQEGQHSRRYSRTGLLPDTVVNISCQDQDHKEAIQDQQGACLHIADLHGQAPHLSQK